MFRNIGFGQQLGIVFSVGIFVLALVTTVVVSNVSTQALRERVISEGEQLVEQMAQQSTLALLYESVDNAEEAVNVFIDFKDIVGISIYHRDGTTFYHSGEAETLFSADREVVVKSLLVSEDQNNLVFMAPVLVEEQSFDQPYDLETTSVEIIGYVSVAINKSSLREMATNIFVYNFIFSFGAAAILLVILLAISRRLLKPIQYLASNMLAVQRGEEVKPAQMKGPLDIQEMFSAFNTMIEILRKREQELQKSRDEAFELAELKGQFAANVSHELRTPMNGVLGMLEMLEESSLTGKEREYLNVARNSAKSLLSLINDILDFSKNEAGKAILDIKPFDLFEQIDEITALLGTQTQKKKIDFVNVMDENLPTTYLGDENRIRQVIINLLSNAIKFTQSGTVGIKVDREDKELSEGHKLNLKFQITDTGIGIDNQKLGHIFEAFSQADGSTTRKFGGTGLGLSICRQLVELMDGKIGVESEVGVGSCFWFSLPLEVVGDSTKKVIPEVPIDRNIKVLVVDGNNSVIGGVRSMMARLGMSCESAESYSQGKSKILDANSTHPYDLVFVDEEIESIEPEGLISAAKIVNSKALGVILSFNIRDYSVENNRCLYLAKPILNSHLLMALSGATGIEDMNPEQCTESLVDNTDSHEFPNKRILVVDDNPVNQLVALGLLKPLNCKTDTAINGIECIAKLSKSKFDLVLMDCNMPEMDGYKASQKIRSQEIGDEHIVIIAITANAAPGDRQKCIASGMDDYLVKPFNREDLRAKLVRWLASPHNVNNFRGGAA